MSVFIRFIYSKSFVCDAFWAVILELLFVNDLSGKKKKQEKDRNWDKNGVSSFFLFDFFLFFPFFLKSLPV